ncbi:MAG: hypothetical protein ACREDR_29760 [Blastocatellia bacterium]
MAIGMLGADSYCEVTESLVQTATSVLGSTPLFWGRYFTSPTTSSAAEYKHSVESPILAENNIRLLPIARQTDNVGGNEQTGIDDAQNNISDLFATFTVDYLAASSNQILMFLDVEGSPSLSLEYYNGWATTISAYSSSQSNGRVAVLPCVYGAHSDTNTWNVLSQAVGSGIACNGAWIARYYYSGCGAHDWDDSIIMPAVSIPCPVFIWQYQQNCPDSNGIDCDQTNPSVDGQSQLVNRLILVPGAG